MSHIMIAVKTTEGGMWIIPQVREARARGHRVTVLTPPGSGRLVDAITHLASTDAGVAHCVSPFSFSFSRPWRVIAGLRRLRRLIRREQPSAILYHLYATALAIRLTSIGLGVRRVYMVAGPLYLDSAVISMFERFLARLDDVVICGSHDTYRRYRRLGLDPSVLREIPYGVDVSRFQPRPLEARTAVRSRLGLKPETFVVTMVAFVYAPKRLVHRREGIKGHRYLLEAWKTFRTTHSDVELLVVGAGFDAAGEEYRRRLMATYTCWNTSEVSGIHWLDSVVDVRDAYTAADISVSPSLSENHGAALEASAMGVPSIVSDAGALPETVERDTGWVFPAASVAALLEYLDEAHTEWRQGTLARRGERARALTIQRFEVTELAREAIDCLDE